MQVKEQLDVVSQKNAELESKVKLLKERMVSSGSVRTPGKTKEVYRQCKIAIKFKECNSNSMVTYIDHAKLVLNSKSVIQTLW